MEIRRHLIRNTALITITLTAISAVLMAFSPAAAGLGAPQAQWSRAYDGGHYDYGSTGLQASDGGFIVGGRHGTADNSGEAYLLKLSRI